MATSRRSYKSTLNCNTLFKWAKRLTNFQCSDKGLIKVKVRTWCRTSSCNYSNSPPLCSIISLTINYLLGTCIRRKVILKWSNSKISSLCSKLTSFNNSSLCRLVNNKVTLSGIRTKVLGRSLKFSHGKTVVGRSFQARPCFQLSLIWRHFKTYAGTIHNLRRN